MKQYICPITQIIISSQALMIGLSNTVGGDEEFSNYGSFDEELLLKPTKNRLWDEDEKEGF